MQNVCQRELRAEGIPETIVGKHISVVDFTVVRAVIVRRPVLLDFIEHAREQIGTEQAGIERADFLVRPTFHVDSSQQVVPHLAATLLGGLKGLVGTKLRFQRHQRLLGRDI